MVKTYDIKCGELADLFLEDHPHLHTPEKSELLALAIQQAIEDFIGELQDNYEPPDPSGFEGGFASNH